jgi:hypothetical protein
MKITTNEFLENCEKTNQNQLASSICNNFIDTMKIFNPDMKHMSNSDWLSVMMNDYHVLMDGENVQLVPN